MATVPAYTTVVNSPYAGTTHYGLFLLFGQSPIATFQLDTIYADHSASVDLTSATTYTVTYDAGGAPAVKGDYTVLEIGQAITTVFEAIPTNTASVPAQTITSSTAGASLSATGGFSGKTSSFASATAVATHPSTSKKSLSTGAVAGIAVVATIVGIAIVGGFIWLFARRYQLVRRKPRPHQEDQAMSRGNEAASMKENAAYEVEQDPHDPDNRRNRRELADIENISDLPSRPW